jgi:hypothetical protein
MLSFFLGKTFETLYSKHIHTTAGMVLHVCSPSTLDAEARGSQIQGNLGYIARPCLKTKKPQLKKKKQNTHTQALIAKLSFSGFSSIVKES